MNGMILWIILIALPGLAQAAKYSVKGLKVESIAQEIDDEEAPFSIRSKNKFHKCGGKSSNLFIVYSEYEQVANQRFILVLEAMKNNWSISASTHGCDGRALVVKQIRLQTQ